jgi:hypothetical protein
MVLLVGSVPDVEEGVFDGPVSADNSEERRGRRVDQAGDIPDCFTGFFAGLFVDEASVDNGNGACAREVEFAWRQWRNPNGSLFYSPVSKLRTPLW